MEKSNVTNAPCLTRGHDAIIAEHQRRHDGHDRDLRRLSDAVEGNDKNHAVLVGKLSMIEKLLGVIAGSGVLIYIFEKMNGV